MLLLKQPFTITEAQDLAKGQTIDVFNIRRSLSPEYDAVCVFVCGDNKGGVNTYRLTADDLHKVEAILENKDYTLSLKKDEGVEPELREARGYLMDVISQALAEMNGHIEISHTELPSVPIKGDWQDEGNGYPYMEVIKGDNNVRDAVFYDVHAEAYPIDEVIGQLDYADTYALTIAVREAQIANLVGKGDEISFVDGLAVSQDDQSIDKDYIDLIKFDQDGKLNIIGHRQDANGNIVNFDHGDMMYLDGYDDLLAAVKDLREQEALEEEDIENVSEDAGITFSDDDQKVIKEAVATYLTQYNSDYYQSDVDVAGRVAAADLASWSDVKRLSSEIAEDILRDADSRDPEILDRYLPEGMNTIAHESQRIGSDTLEKAKVALFNHEHYIADNVKSRIAEVNAMLPEYNALRRAADNNFMFSHPTSAYSLQQNPRDPQQFALIAVKDGNGEYATAFLELPEVMAKVEKIENDLITEYPQLKDFTAMEENKQEEVAQQQEAQEQQVNNEQQAKPAAKKGWNIDYSKYQIPEGLTVEKAQVFKLTTGANAGKYAVSAVINGERKTQSMYKNDVDAYFNKDDNGVRKATAEQLAVKYFDPNTLKKSVPVKEETPSEQQEQAEGQAQEPKKAAGEKKNPFANIDYSKYQIPEGLTVEKANVFKLSQGPNAGKYAVSALVNGQRQLRVLYKNDLDAYFQRGENGERRATLDQLIAKYFGKTAESMAVGSVQEAEHLVQ